MDDLRSTTTLLNRQLDAAVAADPLGALAIIGEVQGDLATLQQQAVRTAISEHSWAEIGQALGVSKQAAHQKFAKEWANTLKDELKVEHKATKVALAEGAPDEAAAAKVRRDAILTEFKRAHRRGKR